MGLCQSLQYEDEDDKRIREQHKAQKKELKELQKQLRRQKAQFSQMDLSGKGTCRSESTETQVASEPDALPSPEQIRLATNIIYDA